MAVIKTPFGKAEKYTITHESGFCASIITYGAAITNLIFKGTDVVLGYDTLEDYIDQAGYLGSTVGRYANRIAKGLFTLNGKEYNVGCNETERGGHLHGGVKGFKDCFYTPEIISDYAVRMTYTAKDGEEGYPGNYTVAVTFTVKENALEINYNCTTDKDTVHNMTNHSYFNLNGYNGQNVLSTELKINADYITPVDEVLIPTGEFMEVKGTEFDFTSPKAIGKDIKGNHPQMVIGGGYDHNFVLGTTIKMRRAVEAHSPISGITMFCDTTEPGVQLYTGNGLNSTAGKNGVTYGNHQGFCLETQHFPDSPNKENFPSCVLKAGETYESTTIYSFK